MFPLDTQGDVGQYPSLGLDPCPSQECPEPPCYNILYYDATLQDVRRLLS